MKKDLTTILGAGLAIQLVVAIALSFSGSDSSAFKATEPLLAFDSAKIDKIDIDESGTNSVSLTKRNGQWLVPPLADFPADGAKIDSLLTKLAALKKGWPVATSSDAATRFKVTDETHERRVTLKSGDKAVGEFLFGTAPSFRHVHARVGGDADIYNVTFANYDAGTRGEEWMKQDLLNTPEDKIASISTGDVTLERKDGKFTLQGLAEGEKQKEPEVRKLASVVLHPVYDAVQGKGADVLAKLNEPDTQVTIKRNDGSTIVYKYKKEAAGGAYIFGSSAQNFLFRVAETSIEPIIKAKRDQFVETNKKDTDGAQAQTKQDEQQQKNASGG